MNGRITLCIQARMGSRRFPGKMLAPLGGMPLFAWLALRLQRCRRVDRWFLATSNQTGNEPLAELARILGYEVYCGDENDLLKRFGDVIRLTGCQHIIRVCGDNPLIAPEEVDRAVAYHLDQDVDYTFNHIPAKGNGYPDGLGAEVFRASVLLESEIKSNDPIEREHINQYIWHREQAFHFGIVLAPEDIRYPEVRLDVDTPIDLEYLHRVVEQGKLNIKSTPIDIIHASLVVGSHPK